MERTVSLSATEYAQLPADLHSAIKEAISIWNDAYNVIRYADRALFAGPPGTGKTTASSKHGPRNGQGLERFCITSETTNGQIWGGYMPTEKGLEYKHSWCARAWLNGSCAVVDEIDQAGGDTIPGLHAWLDDLNVAKMTLATGDVISPKEGFRCFATTNHPESVPEALSDRFVIKRTILVPDPRILFSLPRAIRPAAGYSLYGQNTDKALSKLKTRAWVEIGRLMDRHGLSTGDAVKLVAGPQLARDVTLACEVSAAKVEGELKQEPVSAE